jgi:hypothetical protein
MLSALGINWLVEVTSERCRPLGLKYQELPGGAAAE